jgi:hypothetical protein
LAYGLVRFHSHIFARRNPTGCFMGGQKRCMPPGRYVPFFLKFIENILTKFIAPV